MATVWVVNYAGHDFSSALSWGEIRPLTHGYVSLESLDRLKYIFVEATKDSSPEDWLLLSGLMVLNSLASLIMWHRHGRVNLLIHDRKTEGYRELVVNKSNIDELITELTAASDG